jgi:2-C-methyl-D-erythritol 4-phosphate cytidylyltransferase
VKVTAVIPSAGSGKRMQSHIKKPYLDIKGKPLLSYVLKVLNRVSAIENIVVPVSPGEEVLCEKEVLNGLSMDKEVKIISGGTTRQESVRKALDFVPESTDLVLIHDGVRPFITVQMIERSLNETSIKLATTLGVPVKDTVTVVSEDDRRILKTLERSSLYLIQTPQTFDREVIIDAHTKAYIDGFEGTDDASLVERMDVPVTVIPGSYDNIKITTQDDLIFAEAILSKQNAEAKES